ncbi:MAG TPA: hypothetical protein VFF56_01955, partial [Bacillota bacterium]|nr:hypothetical protein [Bacillota bacterium]
VLMALASRFCFSYRLDHKGIIFADEIASLRCSCSCCLRRLPINPSIIFGGDPCKYDALSGCLSHSFSVSV